MWSTAKDKNKYSLQSFKDLFMCLNSVYDKVFWLCGNTHVKFSTTVCSSGVIVTFLHRQQLLFLLGVGVLRWWVCGKFYTLQVTALFRGGGGAQGPLAPTNSAPLLLWNKFCSRQFKSPFNYLKHFCTLLRVITGSWTKFLLGKKNWCSSILRYFEQ